jgi:excisionase family DNA binding protein
MSTTNSIQAVCNRDFEAEGQTALRPLLHSRNETCSILGVSLSTLKLLIGRGELREIRLGKRRLTPRSEIDRLIAERMAEAKKDEG